MSTQPRHQCVLRSYLLFRKRDRGPNVEIDLCNLYREVLLNVLGPPELAKVRYSEPKAYLGRDTVSFWH